eukprot:TRINITY_DN136385_c0_g1_i1.p1 TRINITY_DN136385_c0_g1~~TRINITY_DN136385_c0_g1_i1.p1  ORF type:complete len:316 (+),score=18.30 TRINITY_DN136385_c0_g1_i1:64-948(+)
MEKTLYTKYRIKQPEADTFLFLSEIFRAEDQPVLQSMEAYVVPIETKSHNYLINCRYLPSPLPCGPCLVTRSPVLMLHGHGPASTWATWLNLAVFLNKLHYPVLLTDLPGFGCSTLDGKKRVNPKTYLQDAPNMIKALLRTFNFDKTHGVGFCGGAATLVRTIHRYPDIFTKRHIFHNCVIGVIPDNFEKTLASNGLELHCTWCEDPDHMKCCVGYKFFNKMRKTKSKYINLQDIGKDVLKVMLTWSKGMGRECDEVELFDFGEEYRKIINKVFGGEQYYKGVKCKKQFDVVLL